MFVYNDHLEHAEYLAEKFAGETIGLSDEHDPEYEFYRVYGFYPEAEAEGSGDGFPFEEEFDEIEISKEDKENRPADYQH